ncbi:MAG: VOC family protein [Burkholderiales bacterium]|nr:VOC family protein [Burkholderiales bacterium]
MRFMVQIRADENTEAGKMPSEQLMADMGAYNQALIDAGVMLAGEGLQPSAKGARVLFSGQHRTVLDGPFAETKELIAGFWLWQVGSLQEAIEWVKRCPNPLDGDSVVEIRQVFEAEDFGTEFAPELRAQEDRQRAQLAAQQAAAKPAVPPVPPARGALPYLTIKGASDAIAFYQRVFGAEQLVRLDAPDGSVLHAELRVGPSSFLLTEERPQMGALGPLTLGGSASSAVLYVPDADAVVARALAAGATATMPLADQFWGDRSGAIIDPFGHHWFISTHLEEPSEDELKRRLQAMMPPTQACQG